MYHQIYQYRRISTRAGIGLLLCVGSAWAFCATTGAPAAAGAASTADGVTPVQAPARHPVRKPMLAKVRDPVLRTSPQREVRKLK